MAIDLALLAVLEIIDRFAVPGMRDTRVGPLPEVLHVRIPLRHF
jgi:hypothetical protein